MRVNVFIFYSAILNCSLKPIFDDHEPDVFKTQLERELKVGSPEKVIMYENTSLYHLGVFDDNSMKFELCDSPVLLLDCGEILRARNVRKIIEDQALELKEKINNGRKEC